MTAAFDSTAMLERYQTERLRRLRRDGGEQYVEVAGEFAHYGADLYAEPVDRAPRTVDVDVALIGAGFGGLLAGARLRDQGVERICLIDKAADLGVTWYWNRYPGIACDVESYIYIPLLEELGYVPTEKYSKGAEIFEHCQRIAHHYDLYRDACLGTEVTSITWDEDAACWVIATNQEDRITAQFVVLSNGFLQKPKLPGIPGIERFGGCSFHTSRWNYEYTGGDANGDLAGLRDKRVGIIGTGATAVQCVPFLARDAEKLYVFQRTPSSVDVRGNRATDPEWASTLEPGWQRRRIENFQVLTAGGYAAEDLVDDSWTDITRKLLSVALANDNPDLTPEALADIQELGDLTKMQEIRDRVDAIVNDPATADALKPYYRYFCKRPCFHDDYLQTFNRGNVALVDTHGRGVDEITELGVIVDGVEYELDCLIFATGFEVGTDYSRRTGFSVVGRNDTTLSQAWADGVRTMHSMHIHGFPNLLMMSTAQAGLTVNFPYLIDLQASHLSWTITEVMRRGASVMEATVEAEQAWVATIVARSGRTAQMAERCTPGYYNNEGQPTPAMQQSGFFFGKPTEFAELLEAWREDGMLAGLELTVKDHRKGHA